MCFTFEAFHRRPLESKELAYTRISVAVILSLLLLVYLGYLAYEVRYDDTLLRLSTEIMREPYALPQLEICGQFTTLTFVECNIIYMNWTFVTQSSCYDHIRFDTDRSALTQCYLYDTRGTLHYGIDLKWAPDSPEIRRIEIYWKIDSLSNMTDISIGIPFITIMLYDPRFSPWDGHSPNNMIPQEVKFSEELTQMTQENYRSISLQNYTSILYFSPLRYRAIPPHDSGSLLGFNPSYVDIYTIASTQLDLPMHPQDNVNLTRGDYHGLFSVQLAKAIYDVKTEQRQHTLLSAVALAGGAYGVIAMLYTIMFGMVRHSPWGLLHQIPLTVLRGIDKFADMRKRRLKKKQQQQRPAGNTDTSSSNLSFPRTASLLRDHQAPSHTTSLHDKRGYSSGDEEMALVPVPVGRKSDDFNHPSPSPPLSHQQQQQQQQHKSANVERHENDRIRRLEIRMLEMQEVLREYYINMDFLDQIKERRGRKRTAARGFFQSSSSSDSHQRRDDTIAYPLGGWLYEDDNDTTIAADTCA